MFGLDDAVSGVLGIGKTLIDRLVPDPKQKAEMQMKLAEMAQRGELEELRIRMSAILAEAQSKDPWTSRARPSFLYVMYVLILFAIPMGILSVFNPQAALTIAKGAKAWLGSIPNGLWTTFGIGYSGYSLARSFDKRNILKGKGSIWH